MELTQRCVVSDIDGVVANTKPLVVEAYRRAGVEMGEENWGKPVHEWLKQPNYREIHQRKNREYMTLLREGELEILPAAEQLRDIRESGVHVGFATSASKFAAQQVLLAAGLLRTNMTLGVSMTTKSKADMLQLMIHGGYHTTYIDDMVDKLNDIRSRVAWAGDQAKFVHYTPTIDLREVVRL